MKNKKLWLVILCGLLLVVLLFFGIKMFTDRPQNLGPELEYVGKEQLGCWPFPFSFICEVDKYHEYYFTTALNQEELITYFSNAHLIEKKYINANMTSSDSTHTELVFELNNSKGAFSIDYLDEKQPTSKRLDLTESTKQYLIRILDNDLEKAKKAH